MTNYGWNQPITCAPSEVGRRLSDEIIRIIEKNGCYFDGWSNAFTDCVELIDYATAPFEEEAYMKKVKSMRREAVDAACQIQSRLLRMYQDYVVDDLLGRVYMEVASRWKCSGLGQFFTPMSVCEMMATIQLGDVNEMIEQAKTDNRRLSICDPAVGSGAMLLGAKKVIMQAAGLAGLDHFEFYGQDVDPVCVRMCKIQMRLTDYRYMPMKLLQALFTVQAQGPAT